MGSAAIFGPSIETYKQCLTNFYVQKDHGFISGQYISFDSKTLLWKLAHYTDKFAYPVLHTESKDKFIIGYYGYIKKYPVLLETGKSYYISKTNLGEITTISNGGYPVLVCLESPSCVLLPGNNNAKSNNDSSVIGETKLFFGDVPDNYIPLNGSILSRENYTQLYEWFKNTTIPVVIQKVKNNNIVITHPDSNPTGFDIGKEIKIITPEQEIYGSIINTIKNKNQFDISLNVQNDIRIKAFEKDCSICIEKNDLFLTPYKRDININGTYCVRYI